MQLVSFNLTKKFQHFNMCLNRKCKFCHLSISVYHCSSTSSSSSSYSGKLSLILSTSSKDSFQPSGPSFISWSVRRHLSSSAWMNSCLRAWPLANEHQLLSPVPVLPLLAVRLLDILVHQLSHLLVVLPELSILAHPLVLCLESDHIPGLLPAAHHIVGG